MSKMNAYCYTNVFRFQEVVPLRAANILGSEKSKICMKWNSLIRKSLNKNTYDSSHGLNSIESSVVRQGFRCLISKQMVGILISVWVRADLHSFVRNPSVSCVGCGIMGCLGNKVKYSIYPQLLYFMCKLNYMLLY